VRVTIGAGSATVVSVEISLKCGSGRRLGAFGSLVQQQDTVMKVRRDATNAIEKRVISFVDWIDLKERSAMIQERK
jgi:hypothetical protein